MAITTTYSIAPLLTRILTTSGIASNSDTVGLSGGGFATVAENSSGFSNTTFYDAAGNVTLGFGSGGTDSKIAQLTNGNVVFAGTDSAGGIAFQIYTSTGGSVGVGPITSNTQESNADVAALAGGGFVVVDQRDFGTDRDIRVYIRDADGTGVTSFPVDSGTADDQNASVAGLADGGFAVAWERIDASGNSAAWVAVYNANGSVRHAPYEFAGSGTINHQMNVTALKDGGFAVGFETNGFSGVQSDIAICAFDASGLSPNFFLASTLPGKDSQAAVTTLSNGLVMSTFTTDADTDTDIRGTLTDPTTGGNLTAPSNPLVIAAGNGDDSESSVSATGLAQFVVSYSDSQFGEVNQKTFQLVRTATGDSADDSFTGDDAVDIVNGLGGSDSLSGAANNDTLNGGDGNDYLNGGAGNDSLNGGANIDILVGGDGNDTLNGSTGADALVGGLGNDTYIVDNAGDEVSETSTVSTEIDTVQSSVTFTLGANLEKLTLTGAAAINGTGNTLNNTITGNSAANILDGGAGNDILIGGLGADSLIGGAGADTFALDNGTDTVTEAAGGGTDTITTTITRSLASYANVEYLTLLGAAAINGTGNTLANRITGNAAANVLDGGSAGADGVADVLMGGLGNDTYVLGNGADVVSDVSGAADLITSTITRSLASYGTIENLTLLGAAAINGTGNALANRITGNGAANVLDGGAGADVLVGGLGNDTYVLADGADGVSDTGGVDLITSIITRSLAGYATIDNLTLLGSAAINGTGNALANTITGNGAANILDGGSAGADGVTDSLIGLLGNDTYVLGNGADTVTDSGGVDLITSIITRSLAGYGSIENLTLLGANPINGTGNTLNNVLTGNGAANILDGGAGQDGLIGGLGNDTYVLADGVDTVSDTSGVDLITSTITRSLASYAAIDNLTLLGANPINGTGNALANAITGNSAANILNGGAGNDMLTGLAGNDTFVFNTALNAATNLESITDFDVDAPGVADSFDTIQLENAVFTQLTTVGDLAADKFAKVAAAADFDNGAAITYVSSTGNLYYDTNGAAAGGATQFAHLTVNLALTNADFFVT